MLNIKFDNSIIDHEGVMGTCDDVLALRLLLWMEMLRIIMELRKFLLKLLPYSIMISLLIVQN